LSVKVGAGIGFVALLAAFWFVGGYFGVTDRLDGSTGSTFLSFALLLAPYWAFGFGAEAWLRRRTPWPVMALLIVPYLVFALPRGEFRWDMCLGILAVVLAVGALLSHAKSDQGDWRDWLVLAILGVSVDLHFFDLAWPVAGLSGLAKLVFVDAGLYGYLVVRPIGAIGFDWRMRWRDLGIGLREFLGFVPIALALGLAIGFLHIHRTPGSPAQFAAGWLFTLFFIAMPEELFFRGLLLNLLERRLGTRWALALTALLFGLAHFNKRATYFNWRYVMLAAVAGIFYGRAWLDRRRLLSSSVTHATVDTVWSIWLR
jgi:membrane protease YdiL (CAAX protease family)